LEALDRHGSRAVTTDVPHAATGIVNKGVAMKLRSHMTRSLFGRDKSAQMSLRVVAGLSAELGDRVLRHRG
jgi:hypothetical protein